MCSPPLMLGLKGKYTPNQKLAFFVLYLKIHQHLFEK